MNEIEKKYFNEAEKAYAYVEKNYDENGRNVHDSNSDLLLLLLAEQKRTNVLLKTLIKKGYKIKI